MAWIQTRRRKLAGAAALALTLALTAGCGSASDHSSESSSKRPTASESASPSASSSAPGDRSDSATSATRSPASAKPSQAPSSQPPAIRLHAKASKIIHRAGDVPQISYHQVRNYRASDTSQDKPYIMPVAKFKAQMRYLAKHHYHTITPHQLLAHLTTGAGLPAKPVLLSFDDSDENQYTHAVPELKRHHFTATFFIMTVVLGKRHYMSAHQLRALDSAGMTIGAHTWDHHRVDQYSGSDWHKQLVAPRKHLAHLVGHPVHYFAYPYGVFSDNAFPHLRRAGYWAAFQLTSNPLSTKNPLYTLQRTLSNPAWNINQFAAHLKH
jgi:peptidoglycan/xylan/chitin deacetylase (PgdA/CDA1 family)